LNKSTFIIGGARSGKSRYALEEASKVSGLKAFIATAEAFDEEMHLRIDKHKSERDQDWITFEEPLHISKCISNLDASFNAIIIDCLTLWVSNVMHSKLTFIKEVEELSRTLSEERYTPIYIVSNEVGLGLVPDTKLGRDYRDNLGYLNRRIAEIASKVYFMAAGIPLVIKEIKV
jgi:adenosylcobinamide kinase / adenosylcobinamide-phosphate guanylyltransferase